MVRNLHTTLNVSRPVDTKGRKKKPASAPPNHMSEAEKLLFNRLDVKNQDSSISDLEDTYDEGDDVSRPLGEIRDAIRRVPVHDLPKNIVSSAHHHSNTSLNIPSVIITDANEHVDLLSSTQRRFSQLYSGLRRFSTSHTVWKTHSHTTPMECDLFVEFCHFLCSRTRHLCQPHTFVDVVSC